MASRTSSFSLGNETSSLEGVSLPWVKNEALYFVAAVPIIFIVSLLPAATLYLAIERPLSLNSAPAQPAKNAAAHVHGC